MRALSVYQLLRHSIQSRTVTVGICGLGYVGLPLAVAAARSGFNVIGFDVDAEKTEQLAANRSYVGTVADERIAEVRAERRFRATTDFGKLANCHVIVICVPTPLTKNREPDLTYIEATGAAIAKRLHRGQLVILESTTYPGTTNQVLKPILEATGLVAGKDFYLGFSPEREDPGNADYETTTIPKVVSGDGEEGADLVALFYGAFIKKVVRVSSNDTAEAVKITENVFRAVNIALVNELKVIYEAMGIDVWEVIDAAKTKPFGFMPFFPGPGLGGHCIPIDPFYLTWKSRENGVPTRFIELAGEINTSMPIRVVSKLEEALDHHCRKTLGSARILILGMAYKKNVSDTRESPALKIIELIEKRGGTVDFHDPLVKVIPRTREHPEFAGRKSVPLTARSLAKYDAAVIVTDHDDVNYAALADLDGVVVDTRNLCSRRGLSFAALVKA